LKYSFLLISIFFLSLLVGCSSQTNIETNPATPEETFPPSPIVPTPASSKTPTVTSSPTPTPLTCWQEGGTVFESQIESELVNSPFEFLVYLPPCYHYEPERYYPVLYLIHGQGFNHKQWDRLGTDEVADALTAVGEISPFMIVMPRVISWEQPPEGKFGQAVMDELIPFIDSTYRTIPDREFRAIGGLSRGAAWSLHLGLTEWELFGIFGAHSLPIFRNDAFQVPAWVDAIPPESFPRIYIDLADQDLKDIRDSTEWFIDLLVEKDIPHEFYVFPGRHEEEYWSAHIEEYIRFYTSEW
jgi:enterochelin esterase-like enzyme